MTVASRRGREIPAALQQWSINQVAWILGVSRTFVYKEMRAGRLKYQLIGKRRRVTEAELQSYITGLKGRK